MKKLLVFMVAVSLLVLISACGKSNKVSDITGSSSNLIGSPGVPPGSVGDVSQFLSAVENGAFVAIPTSAAIYYYSEPNSLSQDYRNRYSSSVYDRFDGRSSDSQVISWLANIIRSRNSFQRCNVGPSNPSYYRYIYNRDYNLQLCFQFLISDQIFYIDLNYPVIANPVVYMERSYSDDSWWIFDYTKTNMDGYYMSGSTFY
ncbi:MAG: hypothetical protein KAQ98_13350 [Bacteriovoracaceae bacterium]|nr:hypothetical protein [Bacteriovoracaceae bacterium]